MSKSSKSVGAELIKGAIAATISVWVMDKITWYMYKNEDPKAFLKEKKAQVHGNYVAHVAVDKVLDATGKKLSDKQHFYAGKGVHYFLGIAPGMLYGVYRHKVKGLDAGMGSLYGFGLFVMMDEILGPVLGLASGPMAYPWQAHVRGLVGHLAVGMVTDGVLKGLDKALPA